jgi:branched-subunit amino acid aminotransferase/4-amino-4-deoxychorismate lyase
MAETKPSLLYFNGRNVPYGDARVHVLATAFKYAATVF